jgi:hypothetical protein
MGSSTQHNSVPIQGGASKKRGYTRESKDDRNCGIDSSEITK